MKISSPAFKHHEKIPGKYTCDGENVSPPLVIEDTPKNAKGLVLICDDPDAPMGTWVHWVVWNIPADAGGLEENIPKEKKLDDGACQGITDFQRHGYGGPCPPGGTHRYYFKLYALDTELDLPGNSTKAALEAAMQGHLIAKGELMGKYKRK